ncbi:MAG TPA: dihydropteroate synthase [Bryobacteraceae bacterium]|nr:dihydropteroate synthase [Bryobacteraceae bacterium]
MQKRYQWKLKQREITLGGRTLLMGILNVTPDSFSDGGNYSDPDRAFARALELEDEGADIIDIGAESTRPGSQRVSEAEELRRLIPVLKRLRGKLNVPISVDTYKSGVADKALEHGAEIINDPTGILLDLQIPKMVTKYDAGLIINHMRGTPETWTKLPPIKNLMRSIAIDLEAAIHRARQGGVAKQQVVIDPGLGFGKRREQNSEIIANLELLRAFDLPLAIGPSRKSFLKKEQEMDTEFATAAAVTACILHGAEILRVHDVKKMKNVVDVADAIRELSGREEEPQPTQTRQQAPVAGPQQQNRLRPQLKKERPVENQGR